MGTASWAAGPPACPSRRSCRWTPRVSPAATTSFARCTPCCRRPGPPGPDESVPVVVIYGHGRGGQDRAGHPLRAPGGQAVPRRPAVRQPARPGSGRAAHGADRSAAVLPGRLRRPAAPDRCSPGGTIAALFRSLVDGKRVLIVLDNASNAAQVRPLLPGSPDCLVVVTSRNQMAGLVAAEGATLITLDVLGDDEAHEMLARRLGQERVAAEPEAADEIVAACARLPLALSIAVGRAAGRAKRPLAELAAELRDARVRLDALEAGRRGHRRAGRAVLVLRPAQPGRRPDVPSARPAPGSGHLPVGRRQPSRDLPGRGGHRAARAHPDPHGRRAPARPVRVPRPAARLRDRSGRAHDSRAERALRPSAGCSTTTCTRPWRPRSGSARSGRRCGCPRRSPACCPPKWPTRTRPWRGSTPRSRCCSR